MISKETEPKIYALEFYVDNRRLSSYDGQDLEEELQEIEGIISVGVNQLNGRIRINFNGEKISDREVVDLIVSRGFQIFSVEMGVEKCQKFPFKWLPIICTYYYEPIDMSKDLDEYIKKL